jgi:hypothetical protein
MDSAVVKKLLIICCMRKPVLSRIEVLLIAVALVVVVPKVVAGPSPTPIAAPVTLIWNPAAGQSHSGYAVYYGVTNQPATNRATASTNLSVTLYDLQANVGYRLYAVSYNSAGVESVPSNQLLLTPGVMSALKITRQANSSMSLKCQAAPGSSCRLLYASTPNATSWQTLKTIVADAAGNVAALDSTTPLPTRRFYRMVTP